MLLHLSINQFTLADQLELELGPGTSVLSGETGAGKSITLDALGLALGGRGSGDLVRSGADRADIHATFAIEKLTQVRQWLQQRELDSGCEVILRRTISSDGRSRAYINGRPVTLQQLRALGEQLIDIHSQQQHQSLLKQETQRQLLDDFASAQKVAATTQENFTRWQEQYRRYRERAVNLEKSEARRQLLQYQLRELEELNLEQGEIEKLAFEQSQLANASEILTGSYQLAALLNGGEGDMAEQMHRALQLLAALPEQNQALIEITQLLDSARIQVDEAGATLSRYIDGFDLDPQRLTKVEERLSAIYSMARKYRVQPEQLTILQQQWQLEIEEMGTAKTLDKLAAECTDLERQYHLSAAQLSCLRSEAAGRLAQAINRQLADLAMPQARIEVALQPLEKPSTNGYENVALLIATNPGQALKALSKVVSGGELSRISLAVQVVTAQSSRIPTLIFDEVDAGIGGATGEVVGRLLRALGETGQVICVTHLAQVAAKAHHHYLVEKCGDGAAVNIALRPLKRRQRTAEIARMLDGSTSKQSCAHAQEMLESV